MNSPEQTFLPSDPDDVGISGEDYPGRPSVEASPRAHKNKRGASPRRLTRDFIQRMEEWKEPPDFANELPRWMAESDEQDGEGTDYHGSSGGSVPSTPASSIDPNVSCDHSK